MLNIGFIGVGNMGFAIIKGIKNADSSNLNNTKIYAYDPDIEKLNNLKSYDVTPVSNETELLEKCEYIFLAIKPQQLDGVLDKIKSAVSDKTVLISICAGISEVHILSKIEKNAKVILVMPNTPLLLGAGATALARGEYVLDNEFGVVCDIFESCGEIAVIGKDKMKEIIAVNGSSPAFIYLFTKAFMDYATSAGIDEAVAKKLFAQTLIGAAKMMLESECSIDDLITQVTSKGGTTQAGLKAFADGNFENITKNACLACTKRAYELAKGHL